MSHYTCLREVGISITTTDGFPPRRYWQHSLTPAADVRAVRFARPPPRARAVVSSDPLPSHVFQVPCDTVTSSDSCFQSTRQLNLVR
jgi:hypothetical protein